MRSLHAAEVDAPKQNLICSSFFCCQPFKSLGGQQTGNKEVNDLLQRKYE